MKFTLKNALAALLLFAGTWSAAHAQNATLISDDHDGIVVRFEFSDPQLGEVATEDGMAILPRVVGDTPLLRAGAPDVSKVDATLMIAAQTGTALEVIDVEFIEMANVDVVPSKGNLYRNVNPEDVAYAKGAVYEQDAFYPRFPCRIAIAVRPARHSWTERVGLPVPIQPGIQGASCAFFHHGSHRGDGGRTHQPGCCSGSRLC